MNLGKLPPFMAMTLGLLSGEGCMNVCLDVASGPYSYTTGDMDEDDVLLSSTGIEPTTVGQTETSADSGSGTGSGTGTGTDTGTGSGTGTGTETGTGSGSDTGTGSDTGSSSGTDGGSSSSGGMPDEPPPSARAAAVERVLSREILPADVLDRLRTIVSKAKG